MKLVPLVILFTLTLMLIGVSAAGDEGKINEGLKQNTGGVYTLPTGTFYLDNQVVLPPNTTLSGTQNPDGSPGTIFVFRKNLGLHKGIVQGASGSTVRYIDFNGNKDNINYLTWTGSNGKGRSTKNGQGNGDAITAKRVTGFKVLHCNFRDNAGDGVRVEYSKDIEFAYNTGFNGGHDIFYAIRCEGVKVHDNYLNPSCNSAIRLLCVSHARIYSNIIKYIKTPDGAGPAIQIQNDDGTMTDVEVCDNEIYDSWGTGFWIIGKPGGKEDLWIHHNVLYRSGHGGTLRDGGITASGYDQLLIENNVFDTSTKAGIYFSAYSKSWGTPGNAVITANIFIGSDYGIYNTISKQSVNSSQNCYYDNSHDIKGGSKSSSDISVNPRETSTPSGFSWEGNKWVCPDVTPSELENLTGIYDNEPEMTADEEAEFEFMNIFSILDVTYDSNLNLTAQMPKLYKAPNLCNVTVYDNDYMPQTRYNVDTDNYTTKVEYEYRNNTSTHYMYTSYHANGLSGYENVNMWYLAKPASRIDNMFVIPEAIKGDENPVKITIFDASGHETVITNYNTEWYEEDLKDAINPFAYLYLAIIGILLIGIRINLKVIYGKWKRLR
jgi:Disaggregatase related